MALFYFVILIVNNCVLHRNLVNGGDPVIHFPPFELRAVSGDDSPLPVPVSDSHLQQTSPTYQVQRQQQLKFHTSRNSLPLQESPSDHSEVENELPSLPPLHQDNSTHLSMHDVMAALGVDEEGHVIKDQLRAASTDEYPSVYTNYSPYPHPPSYGYQKKPVYPPSYPHGYGSYSAPAYHEPSHALVPPLADEVPPLHHASTKLKPLFEKFDLVKPIATKVASKFSGLIGLVLTLLTGSSFGDTELTGFKDIVINGIIKPLLIAKGGIKSLISKLVIPVILLLLINVEYLITVWWLWEDCPAPVLCHSHKHVSYPYQPQPSNIPYR